MRLVEKQVDVLVDVGEVLLEEVLVMHDCVDHLGARQSVRLDHALYEDDVRRDQHREAC